MVRLVVDKGPAAAATMLLLDNSDLRASFIFAGSTMTSVTVSSCTSAFSVVVLPWHCLSADDITTVKEYKLQ